MSIQHVAAILDCRDDRLQGTRKLVLIALANRTDEHGKCWPSQERIAGECGIKVRSLQDHLKALENDGILSRKTKALGQGRGGKTIYTLHLKALEFAHANNAGANNAGANSVVCTRSTPRPMNLQEPTTNAYALDARENAPPPEPQKSKPKPKGRARGASRGSRMPADWQPTPQDYAYASKKLNLNRQEINNAAENFRLWAAETSGRNAVKRDWSAAFKRWMRTDVAYGKIGPGGKSRRQNAGARPNDTDRFITALHEAADAADHSAAGGRYGSCLDAQNSGTDRIRARGEGELIAFENTTNASHTAAGDADAQPSGGNIPRDAQGRRSNSGSGLLDFDIQEAADRGRSVGF